MFVLGTTPQRPLSRHAILAPGIELSIHPEEGKGEAVPNATERLACLLAQARDCRICEAHLPHGPRPVLAAATSSKILIVGQAPGRRVHASGVPWDDPSGDRLRSWLGIDRERFYDPSQIAILPMGFCYPGTGRSGDLPPRPECAPTWHAPITAELRAIETTFLLSRYALDHYMGDRAQKTVTETVRRWREFAPTFFPLPHPSPRNNMWLKRNPWFEKEVVPALRERVLVLIG